MKPFFTGRTAWLAAGLLALAGARLFPQPVGPAAVLDDGRAVDWKSSASLPLGAEYHLIREDPKSGGVQALVRFPKGYSLPDHHHDFDETLIVLTGKLRVGSGGSDKVLGRGGFASIPAGKMHSLKAEGWNGVVMVLTTNGPYSLNAK